MKESIVRELSVRFALRVVRLSKHLRDDKNEYIMSKQILRSGTSIGANISEALCGQSKKDFFAKMYIAYKEAAETAYWLEVLYKSEYLTITEYSSLNNDNHEILKILSSITKKSKQ